MSLIGCRCVDKFFVWVWPDGTQKTEKTARRIQVDKTKTSHIVQVSCGWLTGGHMTSDWSGGALHRLQVRPGVRGGRHEEELPLDLGRGVQDLGGCEPRVAGPGEVQRGLPLGPRQARLRPQARLHQIPEKPHQECQLPRLHPGHFRSSMFPRYRPGTVLQVTGVEVRGRGSTQRHSSPASMTGRVSWAHLATPPARGGAPPRGPLANTYSSSSGYNQGSSSSSSSSSGFNQGSSSSSGYNQGSSSSSSSGFNQGSSMSSLPVGNSPFGPIETPAYANTLPRATSKGAAKHVDIIDII